MAWVSPSLLMTVVLPRPGLPRPLPGWGRWWKFKLVRGARLETCLQLFRRVGVLLVLILGFNISLLFLVVVLVAEAEATHKKSDECQEEDRATANQQNLDPTGLAGPPALLNGTCTVRICIRFGFRFRGWRFLSFLFVIFCIMRLLRLSKATRQLPREYCPHVLERFEPSERLRSWPRSNLDAWNILSGAAAAESPVPPDLNMLREPRVVFWDAATSCRFDLAYQFFHGGWSTQQIFGRIFRF